MEPNSASTGGTQGPLREIPREKLREIPREILKESPRDKFRKILLKVNEIEVF